MMWLTWRQFRAQTIVTAAGLAVLAVLLAVTGPHLAHLYAASGITGCQAHGDCARATTTFAGGLHGSISEVLAFVGIAVVYGAPAGIGLFWGAPLVARELEAGTLRLTWSQSVTRTRWLAVKLGLIGLAAMATAGLLSLMVTWWAAPIYRAGQQAGPDTSLSLNWLDPNLFGAHGIAPVGYAAFAFALGVTAGVLIRRTVPAMAVTLVVFALVQLVMPLWVRPHLITPVRSSAALNISTLTTEMTGSGGRMTLIAAVYKPGAWILSNQTVTPAGHVFTGPPPQACASQTAPPQACTASLARLHLRQVVTYQPASRYWAFQWYETAIFVILALALAGFCFGRVRRRRLG
jgi:ABC-2 family transporter protein